jgi:hypothetical protein
MLFKQCHEHSDTCHTLLNFAVFTKRMRPTVADTGYHRKHRKIWTNDQAKGILSNSRQSVFRQNHNVIFTDGPMARFLHEKNASEGAFSHIESSDGCQNRALPRQCGNFIIHLSTYVCILCEILFSNMHVFE